MRSEPKNMGLRVMLIRYGVTRRQVARELNFDPSSVTKMLDRDLSEKDYKTIEAAIKKLGGVTK